MTKDGRRVAIYARVSTDDQHPEVQLREVRPRARELARARGVEVLEFVDKGVSGSKESRPALDRLIADARANKLGAVVVWKLDRLGRSLKHLIRVLDEFKDIGIDFVSTTEAIDTSSPMGRFTFQVLGALAEFERGRTIERVNAGLAHARARGKRLGRPPRGTPDQIARARGLRIQGQSWRAIAQAVGLPTSTVRDKVCEKPPAAAGRGRRSPRGVG